MMLENAFNLRPDNDILHRISEEVAYHTYLARLGKLHKHSEVCSVLFQGCVRWMPNAFPTKNSPPWFDLCPCRIK